MVVGSVHTKAVGDHRELAEPSRKKAGSDRKMQEIVEHILGSDRIGFGHTVAAVREEEAERVCCSLGKEAGRMVAEPIEDTAEVDRETVGIDHREQEKNNRWWEVATGRASWQKVAAVEAGERHSPRPQDMLGSPTWFQSGLQAWQECDRLFREGKETDNDSLEVDKAGTALGRAVLHVNVSRLIRRHQSLVGQLVSNSHSHLAWVLPVVAAAGMKLEEVHRRMLRQRGRRPELLRACLPNYTHKSAVRSCLQ